jgi:hypothetical protein
MFDLPPELPQDVPFSCVQQAARDYQVPEAILYAIRLTENGPIGGSVNNSNDTKDYGLTQINDVWADYFQKHYKIGRQELMSNPCLSYRASAYVVRYEINRTKDFWVGVGNYHSRTPSLHATYLSKIIPRVRRVQEILRKHYGIKGEVPQ